MLHCSHNQLTSLDLSKNTALSILFYDKEYVKIYPSEVSMTMTTNTWEVHGAKAKSLSILAGFYYYNERFAAFTFETFDNSGFACGKQVNYLLVG